MQQITSITFFFIEMTVWTAFRSAETGTEYIFATRPI